VVRVLFCLPYFPHGQYHQVIVQVLGDDGVQRLRGDLGLLRQRQHVAQRGLLVRPFFHHFKQTPNKQRKAERKGTSYSVEPNVLENTLHLHQMSRVRRLTRSVLRVT
jgi:hypothetical protein